MFRDPSAHAHGRPGADMLSEKTSQTHSTIPTYAADHLEPSLLAAEA